jgi:hypothetical protein
MLGNAIVAASAASSATEDRTKARILMDPFLAPMGAKSIEEKLSTYPLPFNLIYHGQVKKRMRALATSALGQLLEAQM